MPITRGYDTILKEIDVKVETLREQWQRVQFKKRMGKRESFKKEMKKRMDLILKVLKKLQTCRGTLVRVNEEFGNSVTRQRAKDEMERKLIEVDRLIEYFNKF